MQFLFLSILCSVAVSVLLKLAPRYQLDIRQAIAVNYVVAAALAFLWFRPELAKVLHAPVQGWLLLALLGFGLPAMFWVLALAVWRTGVARTDAAMRLSLLLPLLAAFTLFGETFTPFKAAGIVVGLLAIAMIVVRHPSASHPGGRINGPTLLLVVFVGMGLIDIGFKLMAQIEPGSAMAVLSSVFVLAAVISLVVAGVLYISGRAQYAVRHLMAGILLGTLNFGNITSYIAAHRAMPGDPALVFAGMNIGVIVLATLVGVVAFRERLSRINLAGLLLALVAVGFLASA